MTAPASPVGGRDSRVELIAAVLAKGEGWAGDDPGGYAAFTVRSAEAAGLLVLDPNEALVERIAGKLFQLYGDPAWSWEDAIASRPTYREDARAVLAALATPGGGK